MQPAGDEHQPLEGRIAAAAAWGVVALESLYQATPSSVPTCSMRCGGPVNEPSAAAIAVGVGEPGLEHQRRGGQGVGQVVRQLRFIADTRAMVPAGPTSRPSSPLVSTW